MIEFFHYKELAITRSHTLKKTRDICSIRSVWTGCDKMTYKEDNNPSMETWFGMVYLVFIQPYLSVVISDAFDFFAICKHH